LARFRCRPSLFRNFFFPIYDLLPSSIVQAQIKDSFEC
jgi:hypothetical protein